MPTRMLLSGNEAAAWAVARAGAEVVAAYPITPQTTIIETLASLVHKGISRATYIAVESEHSAMAACIGAAQTGARAFTATSAQGLALMHELLHWVAGARLPVVLVDVNRAMAPGWNIWSDQNDSLSQRDTGVVQLYCEGNQEVLDSIIQAFALAARVSLPVMVVLDAFVLSHMSEPVEVPEESELKDLIPPWEAPWRIDVDRPAAIGGLVLPAEYQRMRKALDEAHAEAARVIEDLAATWRTRFGRGAGLIETYHTEDADQVIVTSGTIASTARVVVDAARASGERVGLCKIRAFRPFPARALREALGHTRRVVVLDRNCSYGASGIFCQELRAAFCGVPNAPQIHGMISGMGGRDVTPATLQAAFRRAKEQAPQPEGTWLEQ